MRRALFCGSFFWLALAYGQPLSANQQVERVRANFERGDFRAALGVATEAMASQNFSDSQRLEMNKYAGLSAFNLGEVKVAEEHLYRLLLIDPDYQLDPFEVPPAAISFFAELRKKNPDALEVVRQKLRAHKEAQKREEEERERQRIRAEEQRRRLEQLSRQVTVRTVERRSFLLNFAPFGAGQFQQGRASMGTLLAAVEGALAAASVVAYFGLESVIEDRTLVLKDRLGTDGDVAFQTRGVPPSRMAEAQNWRLAKYTSAAAFWAVYAFGVGDAIYHHQDELVSTHVVDAPKPELSLAPGPGVGLTFNF